MPPAALMLPLMSCSAAALTATQVPPLVVKAAGHLKQIAGPARIAKERRTVGIVQRIAVTPLPMLKLLVVDAVAKTQGGDSAACRWRFGKFLRRA